MPYASRLNEKQNNCISGKRVVPSGEESNYTIQKPMLSGTTTVEGMDSRTTRVKFVWPCMSILYCQFFILLRSALRSPKHSFAPISHQTNENNLSFTPKWHKCAWVVFYGDSMIYVVVLLCNKNIGMHSKYWSAECCRCTIERKVNIHTERNTKDTVVWLRNVFLLYFRD